MDPVTAVLLGIGAALLTTGAFAENMPTWSGLLLTAAFYGVHRLIRTRATMVLVFAPVVAWAFRRFWLVLPSSAAEHWKHQLPVISKAPGGIATLVIVVALATSVIVARARIGRVLAGLTTTALVLSFVAGVLEL